MLPFTYKQLEFLVFVNSLFPEWWTFPRLPEIVDDIYQARARGNLKIPFSVGGFYSSVEFEDKEIYADGIPLSQEEYKKLAISLQCDRPRLEHFELLVALKTLSGKTRPIF